MAPFQGAGAGQAIEVRDTIMVSYHTLTAMQDAYILSTLLSHRRATRSNVARVLQIYSQVRQPIASRVAERSRQNGLYFAMHGMSGDVSAQLPELGRRIQQTFDGSAEGDPLADMRKAVELLETSLGG